MKKILSLLLLIGLITGCGLSDEEKTKKGQELLTTVIEYQTNNEILGKKLSSGKYYVKNWNYFSDYSKDELSYMAKSNYLVTDSSSEMLVLAMGMIPRDFENKLNSESIRKFKNNK